MTKNKLVEFIKHDRSFTGAKNLYNKLPGKSLSAQNSFNRMNDNAENVSVVIYELCKLVGISEREFKIYMNQPITKKIEVKEPEKPSAEELEKQRGIVILSTDLESIDYNALVALKKNLGIETDDNKADTIKAVISAEKEALITSQIDSIPIEVKQSIKLRDQFPFLKEKDCPDILKILVNDLISSYESYTENHELLFKNLTQEQYAQIANEIKEDYIANKEAFRELEHYGKTGELLGEHPLFAKEAWKREFEAMNAEELSKAKANLENKLNRNKKKLEEAPDEKSKERSSELVSVQSEQLDFVKELLSNK